MGQVSYIRTAPTIAEWILYRDIAAQSWKQLGVQAIPSWDENSGNSTGIADTSEYRRNGQRQIAVAVCPLDRITVMLNAQVADVLLIKMSNSTVIANAARQWHRDHG